MISDELKGVVPLPKRKKTIDDLLNSNHDASFGTYPLKFQEQQRHFNIYKISIDLPVYRLNNGRTLSKQEEYTKKNNKSNDFFKRDPESEEAQSAQHEILKKLADESDLLKYFKTHDQEMPLVITKDGYVINGNRRLCVYRMLLSEDPIKYKKFQYVWVIILPNGDEKDFDKVEAQEQITPDIKAKYSWIDKAMLFKYRQQSNNWSLPELASFYEEDEKNIIELIDMLDHADRYLTVRGWPKEYSRVESAEYAFRQLRKFRKKYDDEASCDIFTKACYSIIDHPDMAKDRMYKVISDVYENLDKIKPELKELANESNTKIENTSNRNHEIKQPKIQIKLLGNTANDDTQKIINYMTNPDNSKKVFSRVKEVIDREKQLKKESDNANFSLTKIKDSHTLLQSALTNLGPDSNIKGIEPQLKNIESLVATIRKKVSEYD